MPAPEPPESAPDEASAPREAEFARLRSKWGILRPGDVKERCDRAKGQRFLIEGQIPERSLGLVLGESGLGKSPLAYQMGMCVASGIPFLGAAVRQSRVLYFDFENGLQDIENLETRLTAHLRLPAPPNDFWVWNINDSPPTWSAHMAYEMIRDAKPGLVFIDPISGLCPEAEKSNVDANTFYQTLRRVIRDCGCSIINLHHPKKPPSPMPGQSVTLRSLEDESDPRGWFVQARGASVLVNGADVRLGVDIPGTSGAANSDVALVVRGYRRMVGEIPTMHLTRVYGDDGEPLGYRRLSGVQLLCNPLQEAAFLKLPGRFGFKDAMRAYGRKDQATSDFLKKSIALGILRKPAHGVYEKEKLAE